MRVQHVLQGQARHMLHYQVGQVRQVTRRHKTWHMRAVQHLQNLVLHLEAHNVFSTIAHSHAWHLHHHVKWRGTRVGIGHLVNVRHAARVQTRADAKAV